MGWYIDGIHYTDDELETGPDGKLRPKRRKVLGVSAPAPATAQDAPSTQEAAPDASAAAEAPAAPAGPEYTTKVIRPAQSGGAPIQTKGAESDTDSPGTKPHAHSTGTGTGPGTKDALRSGTGR